MDDLTFDSPTLPTPTGDIWVPPVPDPNVPVLPELTPTDNQSATLSHEARIHAMERFKRLLEREGLKLGERPNEPQKMPINTWLIYAYNGSLWAIDDTGTTYDLLHIVEPKYRELVFIIDGGGSAITTGVKGDVRIQGFSGTIVAWTILGDQSGSIVVDVWKDTYANFAPTVADTIAGSEKPTLSSASKNEDAALSTWTTAIADGDCLRFNVDSATTVTRVTITIKIQETAS